MHNWFLWKPWTPFKHWPPLFHLALARVEKKLFNCPSSKLLAKPIIYLLGMGKRDICLSTSGSTMASFSVKSDHNMLLVIPCYLLPNFQDRIEAGLINMKPLNCSKIFKYIKFHLFYWQGLAGNHKW